MLDNAIVEMLETHWYDGWNNEDVDIIMAPLAEDVIFRSPSVPKMTSEPDKIAVEGFDAVRTYMANSLQQTSGFRYTRDAIYVGIDGVVIVWTCHLPDGSTLAGADSMRVNADGKLQDWCSYYANS